MADSFKSSILLGFQLEDSKSLNTKVENLIKTLNNTKIDLDINIKNSDVAKQLETLTNLANNFKTSLGGNINLGNINEVVNQATNSIGKLNDEVLKTRTVLNQDGTGNRYSEIEQGIGIISKQTEVLNQKTKEWEKSQQSQTILVNNEKIRQSIDDMSKAQERLNQLEQKGYVDQNKVSDLKNMFANPSNFDSSNELNKYLNQVKELENQEKQIIENKKLMYKQMFDDILSQEKQSNSERQAMYKTMFDEMEARENKNQQLEKEKIAEKTNMYKQMFDTISQQEKAQQKDNDLNTKLNNDEFLNSQKNAYSNLNQLLTEEYSLKERLITAEGQYKQQLSERLVTVNQLKSAQQQSIQDNNLSNLQKEVDLESQKVRLEEQFKLAQAKSNTNNVNSLEKDINSTIYQVEKLQQKFGNKLPNGFVESTTKELNSLLSKLKETDNVNFNNIRNSLNTIKSSMEQTTNETKQLVNSLKETNNGGFFGSISNFLSRVGIFYGVQQVVQEITSQLKEAVNYTIQMDKSMTNMQMITGKSKGEVSGIVDNYKRLGEQLHTTNAEMMKGMEEVTRAGFDGTEGEALMSASIMGSKLSGQTTEQVTQQLIAIKNAFNMTGEGMQNVVDMMSKMDNVSATSFKEIASAIQRTAFSAQEAGTPLSNLITYITTVSEKTRRSADTIGESFKTIYSRYSNIKLGRLDEDGKSINDTEFAMNRIGIAIRTNKGQFKEFDTVLQEFMQKFKSGQLSQVDYLAGIQALAGTRQRETLMALMENMDTLNQHQKEVGESAGSAKKMMDEAYGQSLDARIQDLKRAFEQLYEKITNSEQLKWLVTEFTQLVTALSNVDGKTIAFTATVGGLILVMSKLSTLNKTLMMGEAVTGLGKLIAVLTGMSSVKTTIDGVTNATKAMQIAQLGAIAQTEGLTGLKGAWVLLSGGIKEATASAVAFMATPIGMVITAIGVALGIAVVAFTSYQEHQAQLTEQSKSLKSALEGVNEALKGGDTTKAQEEADKMKKAQEKLQQYIELRKKAQDADSKSFNPTASGADKATVIESYNRVIKEQIKVLKDAGYTVDETTGKIKEFSDAQDKIDNTKIINSIKEQTKAQLENRDNLEGAQEEFNNYISTVQNLYSEYQTLSQQESLNAEEKQKLGSVVEQLQGKVGGLNVSIDENGKAYIANSPLIDANIQKLTSEGITVDNLSAIRITDAKVNSQWQVGNSQVTYSEITNRIGMYKAEIQAIQAVIQARMAGAMDYSTMSIGKAQSLEENSPEFEQLKQQQDQLHAYEKAKKQADSLYAGIGSVPYSGGSGGNVPSGGGGNYMPSGGSGGKSDAEKSAEKAEKLSDDIAKMQAKFDTDPYFELNNALKNVNNELEVNKTLLDSLTEGSPEYQQAQLQQIETDKKKQIALQNLNNEQKKQSQTLKYYLTQYGFTFDKMGNMTNSQEQIKYWTDVTNAMTGSTEEDKAKKQEWIDWIKTLENDTKDYSDLVNDKIPSVANQWSEVGNEIKKTTDAMKKANEETYNSLRDEAVQGYLKDQQDKVDDLKKQAEIAKEEAKKANEDEKQAVMDEWDQKIKDKQAELDALNDESEDNEKKLKKLRQELALWKKDDSVFSKSKQEELNTKIAETEKTIQKNNLQKDLDELNKQKQADSDSYEAKVKAQEESDKTIEENAETTYKDMLDEKKAYQHISEALTKNGQEEILTLLKKYDTSYKDIGKQLSASLTDPFIERIEKVKTALSSLTGNVSNIDSNKSSTNDSTSTSPKTYTGTTSTGKSYTIDASGVISNPSEPLYDFEEEEAKKHIPRFYTGGRTGDLGKDGKFVIADSNEMIANANDTKKFDEMYNYIKNSGSLISQLSSQYANPNSYSLPNLVGNNLNGIASNVTNTNNTVTQPIAISFGDIINHNGAEANMNMDKIVKTVKKSIYEDGRRFK